MTFVLVLFLLGQPDMQLHSSAVVTSPFEIIIYEPQPTGTDLGIGTLFTMDNVNELLSIGASVWALFSDRLGVTFILLAIILLAAQSLLWFLRWAFGLNPAPSSDEFERMNEESQAKAYDAAYSSSDDGPGYRGMG